MARSSREPKALTKAQFASVLSLLVLCGVAAIIAMSAMGASHGVCPTENQMSRPGNATCWTSYQQQDKTGVVGFPQVSPSQP
jgi:hypothetical protein